MNNDEKMAFMIFIIGVVGFFFALNAWVTVENGNMLLILVASFLVTAFVGGKHFLDGV